MSQENMEIVGRHIDAWNRGDLDAFLAEFAPEAEFHTTGQFFVYRGRGGLMRYWAELREDLEKPSTSISEIRAVDDKVFVAATGSGRGKRSKVPYEQPFWYIVTLRDGPVERVEAYADPEPALEAAGLSE
jgi:ketosteroid isomerase-like protein